MYIKIKLVNLKKNIRKIMADIQVRPTLVKDETR